MYFAICAGVCTNSNAYSYFHTVLIHKITSFGILYIL